MHLSLQTTENRRLFRLVPATVMLLGQVLSKLLFVVFFCHNFPCYRHATLSHRQKCPHTDSKAGRAAAQTRAKNCGAPRRLSTQRRPVEPRSVCEGKEGRHQWQGTQVWCQRPRAAAAHGSCFSKSFLERHSGSCFSAAVAP